MTALHRPMIKSVRLLAVALSLYLLLACTAAPIAPVDSNTDLPSGVGETRRPGIPPEIAPHDNNEFIDAAVQSTYPGHTAQELAHKAWMLAQQLYGTQEMEMACDDPVLIPPDLTAIQATDTFYALLAEHYNKPILWKAFVNFSLEKLMTIDDTTIHTFIGCFHPSYEMFSPDLMPDPTGEPAAVSGIGEVVRAYYPTKEGHPFICFPLLASGDPLDNGNPIQVNPHDGVHYAADGIDHERTEYFADFDGNTYLWCPVNFARSIQKWESNEPTGESSEVDGLNLEIAEYLAGFWENPEDSAGYAETIQSAIREINVIFEGNVRNYDYLLAYAGLRGVEGDQALQPFLDYLPTCLGDSECASGYQSGLKLAEGENESANYTVYQVLPGEYFNQGPYYPLYYEPQYCVSGSGAARMWGELQYPDETCFFDFPDDIAMSSLYAVGDLGSLAAADEIETHFSANPAAMAADRDQICDQPVKSDYFARARAKHYMDEGTPSTTPMVCSGTNMTEMDETPIPFWMGDAHYIIGLTRLNDANGIVFSGTMEYVWFDPDQGNPD